MTEIKTAANGQKSAAGKKARGEMKAVRLTASVVGAVVVLWMPYCIGGLMLISGSDLLLAQYISDVGLVIGFINSCINWIIYGAASRDFRKAVWQMFKGTTKDVSRVDPSIQTAVSQF
jgi:7 transmembrane receptor (rhodopsin family)